jgi:ATP-binding cassette subfamily B protein
VVPEIVQTSNMDCGPASLAALLTGLGLRASYEQLRLLCATDVDGTNIDTMEAIAVRAGTDAEQLVVPAEHVLAQPEEYLPAIAVTLLPDGFVHFVVVWSKHGRWLQVMDPAHGRRWVTARSLLRELHRHAVIVATSDWRMWAGSDVFLTGLRRRLHALHEDAAEDLVAAALADPTKTGLARLDAAIRMTAQGRAADVGTALDSDLPDDVYSCADHGGDEVELRGAVIVRARHMAEAGADPELRALLARRDPSTMRTLGRVVRWRWAGAVGLVGVGAIAGAAMVGQDLALRPFLEGEPAPPAPAIAAVLLAGALWLAGAVLAKRAGRNLELGLRRQLAAELPRLPDSWIRSRPVSDQAERAHFVHRVRELPDQIVEFGFALGTILFGVIGIAMLTGQWPLVLVLMVFAVGIPALTSGAVAEQDLRFRTLAGCLSTFVQDALLGAEALGSSHGHAALRSEFRRTLAAWRTAGRTLVRTASVIRLAVDLPAMMLVAAITVVAAATRPVGVTVVVALLAMAVADGGARLADALRAAPLARSVLARLAAWLAAGGREDGSATIEPGRVKLSEVAVRIGAVDLLEAVSLDFPAGTHVAVVGPSGSGKTTLLGLVLGVIEPSEGTVEVGAGRGDLSWVAVDTRLWNDTITANVLYGNQGTDDKNQLALAEGTDIDRRGTIGEGGRLLSDGQAQRVRLARGFGRQHANIVVLDEPFQGLERQRRRRLLKAARSHWAGATLICCTHDVSDTIEFDRVVVVESGRVAELGRPHDLAQAESRYRQLLDAERADPFGGWRRLDLDSSR